MDCDCVTLFRNKKPVGKKQVGRHICITRLDGPKKNKSEKKQVGSPKCKPDFLNCVNEISQRPTQRNPKNYKGNMIEDNKENPR